MSKVKALYHIVFCTKARQMSITPNHAEDLYRFIWKDVTDLNCKLVRIGGIQNHIHMLVDLHPSVALATLMRTIKANSSGWMRKDPRFPLFNGWASEYYACAISPEKQDSLIEYIKNQQIHHLGSPFDTEILKFYQYAGLQYHDLDLQ